MAAPIDLLGKYPVAELNLACAAGLPVGSNIDFTNCTQKLGDMAARVGTETSRHLYRFHQNPSEFERSEGFFRMIMMGVVLSEDFQIKYAPSQIRTAANARLGDGFFADSRNVFLHGLLEARRQGTCSSLPVLYVAIGRKLGYPLNLVTKARRVQWRKLW